MVIDWTRAAVTGALVGAVFWAVTVYALIASESAVAAWVATGVVAVALLVAGTVLYRSAGSSERRCYGAGLVLAPLTGLVPAVVFVATGLVAHLGAAL
ncbi:Transmembrane protein [Mycobacterium sp. smrl_JER01]